MKIKLSSIIYLFIVSAVIGVSISYEKIYFFHIILFILLLSVLYLKGDKFQIPQNIIINRYHYFFYFMFFWYLFSIIWSVNIIYTIQYLFYLLCGVSLSLCIVYYGKDISIQNKIFKALCIIFSIEIIICLLEGFTDFRLPISPYSESVKYFGRDIGFDQTLDQSVINTIVHSPTGFQWNPNNLAITMVIILPFILFHSKWMIKIVGLVSIIAIIVMTGSRGAFIAFTAVILSYLLFYNKKLLFVSAILIFFLFSQISSNYGILKESKNQRIKDISNSFLALHMYLTEDVTTKGSIGTRQQLMRNGIKAFEESYGIGIGGGCSRVVQEKMGGVNNKITSMHNFWVEMLVDVGVVFSILFFLWYFLLSIKLYAIAKSKENERLSYFAKSCFLSLIGFLVSAISASSVVYLLPMWILFGFSIITIYNYNNFTNANLNSCRS